MTNPQNEPVLTRVTRYNFIRDGRLLYIDVHEAIRGSLAAPFVAVPNLINIIARQEFQGTGPSEKDALDNCLEKIATVPFETIFPEREPSPRSAEPTERH